MYDLKLNQGDGLWCAFDVDNNTNEDIKNAYNQAVKNKIMIALSNPSFEHILML